jgi:uncharacterized protein YdaU (DUF1376 family)
MTQTHYLPMFFGDLLASTPTWEGEERALYMLLLAYQWTAGPLPSDPKKIARMCQYETKAFLRLWVTVSKKFVDGDEGLVNLRLEEHRQKAIDVSNKRALAGAKGGAKNKQKTEQTESKQEAIASVLYSHPIQSYPDQESKSGEDPRKKLFDLGKSILGSDAGSLISKAIKSSDEVTVGRVLAEMALSAKAEPRSYFIAATKPKQRGAVC